MAQYTSLTATYIMRIMRIERGDSMRFREVERLLLNDGWKRKNSRGSHNYYIHPTKPGKVTIPNHRGDLDMKTVKSILSQAGLK